MPTPNVTLARRILEHIEAHPEEWQQNFWAKQLLGSEASCGTAFCYAGHAVHMAHPDAEFQFYEHDLLSEQASDVQIPGVGLRNIKFTAQELLGLSDYSADVMFAASNTLEHLRDYVGQLSRPDFRGDLVCVNPLFDDGTEDYD